MNQRNESESPREPRAAPGQGVTRRGLLRGAGVAAAAGSLLHGLEAHAEESGAVRTQGPGAVAVTLSVNGAKRELLAEPRVTLLEALRLKLDLTGAKDVCDRGTCGACTVWLDGEPVYACSLLALECEGHEITTVEGLGTPAALHPVQTHFVEQDALQCGFCTPGMVMSCAHALKQHGPGITAEQVRAATAGNLCRCGTYPHVLKAALAAAKGA